MSKVLVTVDHHFLRTPDGKVWVKTIYGYDFWKRYLGVFDQVRIAARVRDVDRIDEKMLLSSGENVEFYPLPQYRGAKEYVLRYGKIKKQVKGITQGCDCAIFRVPSPIANLIKDQVVKHGLPWATEIINDPWDNFAPGVFKSVFRPVYRRHFTKQVKTYAEQANGASYVTQFALQNRYPSFARLYGETPERFESYYSSIILHKAYFWNERTFPERKDGYTIVHVNSCVTDFSKGHDVVIRTCKILREKGLDVRVVFIGDGPKRAFFEQMADEAGLSEYVRFTGLLSGADEVRQVLIDSDILVFPTIGEGLPRTVIEAMAVGLPSLSTAVNGIPELLEAEDMLPQQDAEAFADRAMELLTNKEHYLKVSRRNIAKAQQYENEILTARRNAFYGKLLSVANVKEQ